MTYIIPNQSSKQHSQTNKNDVSGTIYKSKNISLDEAGYIKLAEATYAQFTTDNDADFDTSDAMFPSESEIYINSDHLFSGTLGIGTLSDRNTDTNPPTPSVEEDVIYFNGTEVVSDGTNVKYKSAPTTWTTVSVSGSGFSASNPTCLTVWDTKSSLCVGNSNVVKFISTGWAVNATVLTLPNEYNVSSMASNGTQLFIATRSKSGGDAKLFVVGNIQVGIDSAYSAGTFEIMSLKRFKDSIAAVNSLGQLQRFNGGGFDELAVLPVFATNIEWADAQNDYSTLSNRAMVADGDLIYVNLSAFTENGRYQVLPYFPSGIWCYDDSNKSFYPKYAPSYTRIQSVAGSNVTVNTTDNTFTLTSGNLNDIVTGMPVLFDKGSTTFIPELKESTAYYIIKSSSTVFKLATSYDNAIATTAIDITSAGNVSQAWYIYKTNDYGWSAYDNRMSLAVLNNLLFNSKFSGRLAYTADLGQKQSISTSRTVFGGTNPFIPNIGYFVTPKLNSQNIEDVYNNIYLKFKPLGENDKILVKVKTREKYGVPFSSIQGSTTTNWVGTWIDTDTFTTVADMSLAAVGDEIEIVAGVGAGFMSHISSISLNTGTYTVNLTEAFPFAVANDQMRFQVDNFALIETITSSTKTAGRGFAHIPVGQDNTSQALMVKVELRGVETTISEMQVFHKKFFGESV